MYIRYQIKLIDIKKCVTKYRYSLSYGMDLVEVVQDGDLWKFFYCYHLVDKSLIGDHTTSTININQFKKQELKLVLNQNMTKGHLLYRLQSK